MAADAALLAEAIRSSSDSAFVRTYRWTNPAMSFGANIAIPDDVRTRCDAAGLEIVSRPTGGGAVLHRGDITYAVVMPHGGRSVMQTYGRIALGLIAGLGELGIEARISERSRERGSLACFAVPTGADLSVGGRKICGSAQLRRATHVLQHGSIPVLPVRDETARLLGLPEPGDSTCIQERRPGTGGDCVAEALLEGFRRTWGAETGVTRLPNSLVVL